MEKECRYCGEIKHESEFFMSRKTGWREHFCKACKIEWKRTEEAQLLARTKKRRSTVMGEAQHIQEQLD